MEWVGVLDNQRYIQKKLTQQNIFKEQRHAFTGSYIALDKLNRFFILFYFIEYSFSRRT